MGCSIYSYCLSLSVDTPEKAATSTTTVPRGVVRRVMAKLEKSDGKGEGHYRKRALPLYYAMSRTRANICSVCSNILPPSSLYFSAVSGSLYLAYLPVWHRPTTAILGLKWTPLREKYRASHSHPRKARVHYGSYNLSISLARRKIPSLLKTMLVRTRVVQLFANFT